jgi:hypothetical protein
MRLLDTLKIHIGYYVAIYEKLYPATPVPQVPDIIIFTLRMLITIIHCRQHRKNSNNINENSCIDTYFIFAICYIHTDNIYIIVLHRIYEI